MKTTKEIRKAIRDAAAKLGVELDSVSWTDPPNWGDSDTSERYVTFHCPAANRLSKETLCATANEYLGENNVRVSPSGYIKGTGYIL